MPQLEWSDARDAWLRRFRAEGRSWAEIAAELGVTPDVARERGRRIGAPAPAAAVPAPVEDPYRLPLRAGHPHSWGLLNEGTWLAGTSWPGWD